MRFSSPVFALVYLASSAAAFTARTAPAPSHVARASALFSSTLEPPKMTRPQTKAPVFDEVCETTGVTLTRFMHEVAELNPETRELTILFDSIGTACKAITNMVKRSQLPSSETLGMQGDTNVNGDDQKKLDMITNDVLKRALRFTGRIGVLASEEEDKPMSLVGEKKEKQVLFDETEKYVAVFDPLDGSSNVDAGIPTGTIIGVYEYDEDCKLDESCVGEDCTDEERECMANSLQPGVNLVAAAYCLYSSSTFLTITLGNGVYMFTLDETIGEFVLSHPDVKVPEDSKIYSLNEANFDRWDPKLQGVVKGWKNGTGANGKIFTSRFIGSMVGDVHRTLLYGGVFGYPGDTINKNGKLRLLYEGAPMSFIMEQAGGLSVTGETSFNERVMEVVPKEVHQRVPIMMGSRNQIEEVLAAYKE